MLFFPFFVWQRQRSVVAQVVLERIRAQAMLLPQKRNKVWWIVRNMFIYVHLKWIWTNNIIELLYLLLPVMIAKTPSPGIGNKQTGNSSAAATAKLSVSTDSGVSGSTRSLKRSQEDSHQTNASSDGYLSGISAEVTVAAGLFVHNLA